MTLHASSELRQVIAEAQDISDQVGQRMTSAHLLLALFTVHNRAEILLKEKQVDEDSILAYVHTVDQEAPGVVKTVQKKAKQIAVGCGAEAVDCLHLVIALCGMRDSLAYELLRRTGLSIPTFRNTALSYVTGNLPRRFTVKQKKPAVSHAPAEASPPRPVRHDSPMAEDNPEEDARLAEEEEADYPALANNTHPPTDWDLEPTRFPLLSRLGRNLTSLAALGKIDPLIGRDQEVTELIDTLLKRRANNPLLVGEPGVGKTAIVEGLALRIVRGSKDTEPMHTRRIIELDVASLLAGTQLRGSFSEKLQQIRSEVKKADGSVVVFIDEIHTLMGAGSTGDGPQDAANELKASLARGEFPCIGATTHDEFRRFIDQDAALVRRFRMVQVPEPSAEDTLLILKGIAEEYAKHHGATYTPEALEAAVHLSSRYITDRCLPDKAISLLDLAGSRARRSGKSRVDREGVARVVSSVAGIPVDRLLMTDAERLLNMEKIMGLQLIGHTRVVRSIANVIRRNYAGFAHRRPIGSLLFLGPTGVGKTECARALANFLFSNRADMVQLDMSEYTEAHNVSRLIGAPPGYLGHQDGGQLTEAVRRRPYSIVLFDEVEKAHPEVQQILLQIMDEGRLTDGRGRHVDFTNTVVILTTNLGANKLASRSAAQIGFGTSKDGNGEQDARDAINNARKHFPPELWGRMEEHLFFRPLTHEDLAAIASIMVKESSSQLEAERGMSLTGNTELSRYLVDEGCQDLSLGARPLRQAVRRLVEEPLAEKILAGKFVRDDQIRATVESGRVQFSHV